MLSVAAVLFLCTLRYVTIVLLVLSLKCYIPKAPGFKLEMPDTYLKLLLLVQAETPTPAPAPGFRLKRLLLLLLLVLG